MWVALKVLIVVVLTWHSGVSSNNVRHFNAPPGKRPTIKDCKQLSRKTIDCRNLGFQNVPYDVFSVRGVKIYLSQNPYICDCSLTWFLQEPTSNKKRIIDYNNMKCASPTKMKGTSFKGLKRGNSICKTKQHGVSIYCRDIRHFWYCSPNKILRCGCDTVWLIRALKTSQGKRLLLAYKVFFCQADKAKGVSKAVPIDKVTEAQFCPQKENDPCKGDPCPDKMTVCKYTAKSYVCLDVNECLKSPCKKSEVCVNKIKTGYECACPKDFIRDKASRKCIHRDPCQRGKKLCPSTTRCETIRSSSGTSHRCVDIDECLTGTYTCGEGEECRNKRNGYECRCMPGLTRERDKCVAKVDPCKAKPPVCNPKTERCVSENWESYECLDIDECDTQQHDCDVNAKCINANHGYKCLCKPGFKEYDNGRKCVDLNECSDKFSCAKHAKCINIPGSYKCECNSGYSGDGKYCNDENECKSSSKCSVDAICKNKAGSFECVCKEGYYGNGRICKDINECSRNKYNCPVHSKCQNTPGSYTCKCRQGLRFENEHCADVDECKTNSHNCDKNALCINFVGSYKCRCKDGFEHLKNGRLCLNEETMSKSSSTLIITVAVSVSLPLLILMSWFLYYHQRRNNEHANSEKVKGTDTPPKAQTVFMFQPRAH